MPCVSRVVLLFIAALIIAGGAAPDFHLAAQGKKDAKGEKKDKKDEPKDKKEEKKEPFKLDAPLQDFTYVVKGEKDETGKTFWVTNLAFGPGGKHVAAVYRDRMIKVWDLPGKKDSVTIKPPTLKGLGEYRGLVYADDKLYVGTGELIKVTKAKEKEKDKAKEKAKDAPFRLGEIKSFDAKTGKEGPTLIGHTLNIECLAISKDGQELASGSEDGTVLVWKAGKQTQTIKGHTDAVTGVAFSPDAKQLVTTSLDRTLRVWSVADAKEVALFKIEREVETKDAKGKITKTKELARDFTGAAFSADGKKIIAANRDGMIKIYDIEAKKELQEIKGAEGIVAFAITSDAGKFAVGSYDGLIKIWSAEGKELKTIKAHVNPTRPGEAGTVISLSFSPDGATLASGGIDGVVRIWGVK